jgi:hypothetical protein
MRKSKLFATAGICILAIGMACAQKTATNTRQPIPVSPLAAQGGFTDVDHLLATPSSIPFTANDPGGEIAGGSIATITWSVSQGKNGQTWTLSVGTTSSSFNGCTTVPASAISVKCVSASVSSGGQSTAGCNLTSFTTLPSRLPGLQVASGNEGNSASHNYTVVLSYQLADSWRYIANTCPLTVSYTVNAQ